MDQDRRRTSGQKWKRRISLDAADLADDICMGITNAESPKLDEVEFGRIDASFFNVDAQLPFLCDKKSPQLACLDFIHCSDDTVKMLLKLGDLIGSIPSKFKHHLTKAKDFL